MRGIRAFILARRRGALAAMLLAFALRLFLPGGLMPEFEGGQPGLAICHGVAPASSPHRDAEHGREMPCAFSGLALAALSGDAPPLFQPLQALAQPVEPRPLAALRLNARAYIVPPAQGPPQARSA